MPHARHRGHLVVDSLRKPSGISISVLIRFFLAFLLGFITCFIWLLFSEPFDDFATCSGSALKDDTFAAQSLAPPPSDRWFWRFLGAVSVFVFCSTFFSMPSFAWCVVDVVHVYSEIFTSDYPTYCAGLGLGGNPTVASWSNLCDAPNFSKPFGLGGDQTPLQKSEASEWSIHRFAFRHCDNVILEVLFLECLLFA